MLRITGETTNTSIDMQVEQICFARTSITEVKESINIEASKMIVEAGAKIGFGGHIMTASEELVLQLIRSSADGYALEMVDMAGRVDYYVIVT